MTITDVFALLAGVIVIFTCIYILIFVSKMAKGVSISVNVINPTPVETVVPSRVDIDALQKALDASKEANTNTAQGIDSMLTELNMYMTGGSANVQDK